LAIIREPASFNLPGSKGHKDQGAVNPKESPGTPQVAVSPTIDAMSTDAHVEWTFPSPHALKPRQSENPPQLIVYIPLGSNVTPQPGFHDNVMVTKQIS